MAYVDGFVIPVPTRKLKLYRRLARATGKIFREYGALEFRECVGDDLIVNGKALFPAAVKARRGETVLFSWITFKSKAHRNSVSAGVMKDQRMLKLMNANPMPFDINRMLYGGFRTMVDL